MSHTRETKNEHTPKPLIIQVPQFKKQIQDELASIHSALMSALNKHTPELGDKYAKVVDSKEEGNNLLLQHVPLDKDKIMEYKNILLMNQDISSDLKIANLVEHIFSVYYCLHRTFDLLDRLQKTEITAGKTFLKEIKKLHQDSKEVHDKAHASVGSFSNYAKRINELSRRIQTLHIQEPPTMVGEICDNFEKQLTAFQMTCNNLLQRDVGLVVNLDSDPARSQKIDALRLQLKTDQEFITNWSPDTAVINLQQMPDIKEISEERDQLNQDIHRANHVLDQIEHTFRECVERKPILKSLYRDYLEGLDKEIRSLSKTYKNDMSAINAISASLGIHILLDVKEWKEFPKKVIKTAQILGDLLKHTGNIEQEEDSIDHYLYIKELEKMIHDMSKIKQIKIPLEKFSKDFDTICRKTRSDLLKKVDAQSDSLQGKRFNARLAFVKKEYSKQYQNCMRDLEQKNINNRVNDQSNAPWKRILWSSLAILSITACIVGSIFIPVTSALGIVSVIALAVASIAVCCYSASQAARGFSAMPPLPPVVPQETPQRNGPQMDVGQLPRPAHPRFVFNADEKAIFTRLGVDKNELTVAQAESIKLLGEDAQLFEKAGEHKAGHQIVLKSQSPNAQLQEVCINTNGSVEFKKTNGRESERIDEPTKDRLHEILVGAGARP